MEDKSIQKRNKYRDMEREGEIRRYSLDYSMPFLSLERAEGSYTGGQKKYYLYNDGTFVKVIINRNHNIIPKHKYGDFDVMHYDFDTNVYKIKLDSTKVNSIKDFLEKNIKKSDKGELLEGSHSQIVYIKGKKEIKIINNSELFDKIVEVIPNNIDS